LALADAAAPRQRRQQEFVDVAVERRELQPLLQVSERLVVGSDADETLEQRGAAIAESSSLGGEPAAEERAAADFQPLEEVAADPRRQLAQALRAGRPRVLVPGASHVACSDEAIGEVQPDGVVAGLHARATRLVDDAADLAEAPS